jgi:hypothetical protein
MLLIEHLNWVCTESDTSCKAVPFQTSRAAFVWLFDATTHSYPACISIKEALIHNLYSSMDSLGLLWQD